MRDRPQSERGNTQGKTIADAKGDIFRGVEVVEFACGIAPMMMGETVENVSAGMDTYSYRVPLGVCGGIAPFNFPAMIPLWMFPLAITTGNTFILKPSERVPTCAQRLVELLELAGSPPGVVNIVHGSHDTVNFLCDAPNIKALSFVGSNQVQRVPASARAGGSIVLETRDRVAPDQLTSMSDLSASAFSNLTSQMT